MDEKIKKKLKEGWIRSSLMIEALAIKPEIAKQALKKLTEKLEKEKKTIVYDKKWFEEKEINNPLPNVKKAWSSVVRIELLTQSFEQLVWIAMNYGPTSIEILEPSNINIGIGEAQSIANTIADMVHKFAASRTGGIILRL